MGTKLGKMIPPKLKNGLIHMYHAPSRLHARLFQAASHGKIYCPDKLFLKWHFKVMTGRKLNLKNPVLYQEKLQWLKYYYRNPLYTQLVDKYNVRSWVAEKIGEEYLVPLYEVYDSFDEIDFDALPNKFVLKCTHDSGSVVICKDKKTFDVQGAQKVLEEGLARKQFYLSREWPYKNVKPRIICEKYLRDDNMADIRDYKFFCFDGTVKVFKVDSGRQSETGQKTNYYTVDGEFLEMRPLKCQNDLTVDISSIDFKKMAQLAEVLGKGMPHVRVDFYYINDRIYFGEMTFYSGGGRSLYTPESYNELFGSWLTLPEKMR